MDTILKVPTDNQLENIALHIKEQLLRNWSTNQIASGIRRVRVNAVGFISEVYVSQGLFARLCHQHFGDRTRRAFDVGGYRVKSWRPNLNGKGKS